MRHTILIAAAALSAVCAACNRPSGDQRAATTLIVYGCVQPAEQGLGSANRENKPDQFMLTNAKATTIAAPAATASEAPRSDAAATDASRRDAGTPGSPDAVAPGTMYLLDGKADELREHVNHQVEITGRLDTDTRDSSDLRHELHVDSVRMVAATCSR